MRKKRTMLSVLANKIVNFLACPMPCQPLCANKFRYNQQLRRPHLSCLTCLDRRYYYNKIDRKNYARLPPKKTFAFLTPKSQVIMPKNSIWYFLIINREGSNLKLWIKTLATKFFLTCAELFANWWKIEAAKMDIEKNIVGFALYSLRHFVFLFRNRVVQPC